MRGIRLLEQSLPPAFLRVLFVPLVLPFVLADGAQWEKLQRGWRLLQLDPLPSRRVFWRERLDFHLTRLLNFWPDRLAFSRWSRRVKFDGLDALKLRIVAKQPTVLVCVHHGPMYLLRYFLRAYGVPCAMIVLESRAERSSVREQKDRLSLPVEVPNVFCRDELKAAAVFLRAGGCLLLAVDYGRGRMDEIAFEPARIRIANGAFRMAANTDAMMMAVDIIEEAPWRFVVQIGQEVEPAGDYSVAMDKVMRQLHAMVLATPEQMHTQLCDSLSG